MLTRHLFAPQRCAWIIFSMCPANVKQRYNITLSLIGWAQTQYDPWMRIHKITDTNVSQWYLQVLLHETCATAIYEKWRIVNEIISILFTLIEPIFWQKIDGCKASFNYIYIYKYIFRDLSMKFIRVSQWPTHQVGCLHLWKWITKIVHFVPPPPPLI